MKPKKELLGSLRVEAADEYLSLPMGKEQASTHPRREASSRSCLKGQIKVSLGLLRRARACL